MGSGTDARIVAALTSLVHRSRAADMRGATPDDAPAPVVAALGALAEHGELRMGALAGELGLDTSVVSRTVATAESLGLVSRRPDPRDGRACLLSLTPAGETCLRERHGRRLRPGRRACAAGTPAGCAGSPRSPTAGSPVPRNPSLPD